MKKKFVFLSFVILLGAALSGPQCLASSFGNTGKVTVEDNGQTPVVDPEFPDELADPGPGPATAGTLRFGYASSFDFGEAQIKKTNRVYHALAQQFNGETGPRGSYVQIIDRRGDKDGWSLQVKQTKQFNNSVIQNLDEQELKGATLSLDKAWANSSGISKTPTVTRDTIEISLLDTAYEVAKAGEGEGKGVWTIEFGASADNKSGQDVTLTPLKSEDGSPVMDTTFDKPAYSNSAISLAIPDAVKIYPVQYQTELTWILSELP